VIRTPRPSWYLTGCAVMWITTVFGPSASAASDVSKDLEPLLKTYCYRCHGDKKQKGELNLKKLVADRPLIKNREAWIRVIDQISVGKMPPEDEKQPPVASGKHLLDGLNHHMTHFDCASIRNPGRVTIHRLNNTEYDNTVRDLLGVDVNASRRFPGAAGGGGGGFDNNADTLFLSAILMERYLDAAEEILNKAIPPKPITTRYEGEKLSGGGSASGSHRVFDSKGAATQMVTFSRDGLYDFTLRAAAIRSGIGSARVTISLDGKIVRSFSITASPKAPRLYRAQVRVNRGRKKVGLAFTNPHTDKKKKTQRKLILDYLEISGPATIRKAVTSDSEKMIFAHRPGDGLSHHDAAKKNLQPLLHRAFRRPPTEKELGRFLTLFDHFDKRGDGFEQSMRMALKAILVHPAFLFRVHADRPGVKGDYLLDPHEIATRLSYFLWASMPDQTLFDLAAKGKLQDETILLGQIDRMLKDPKAKAFSRNFALQWLGLNDLGTRRRPDRRRFPEFTLSLRNAMKDEPVLFFESIVHQNSSLLTLLDADYTFVNEELAKHYGLKNVKGAEMKRVRLQDTRRGGVLGMAGVLTVTSYPLRTSPVLRGKWVLETLLGSPPPPPAPDVGSLPEDPKDLGKLTLRKKLERHRADPSCAGCHNRLDPLGFGLENFDAIGRWRTRQNGRSIDASGTLISGRKFSGPQQLRKILMTEERDRFIQNLTENMLSYALGRELEYYDQCAVRRITDVLSQEGFKIRILIREVVRSHPFRYRRNASLPPQGK
jgi:hypothetical protein